MPLALSSSSTYPSPKSRFQVESTSQKILVPEPIRMDSAMFNTLDTYFEGNPMFDYLVLHIALLYMIGSLMIICIPPRISLRAAPFILLSIYGGTILNHGNSGASSYSCFAKYLLAGNILNTINIGILGLESHTFPPILSKKN